MTEPLITTTEDVDWDLLTEDDDRFEYASYVVNTAPEDRPEISEVSAKAALAWISDLQEDDS